MMTLNPLKMKICEVEKMSEQIEEMINDIYYRANGYDTSWYGQCERLAEELYNMGYRKQEWMSFPEQSETEKGGAE